MRLLADAQLVCTLVAIASSVWAQWSRLRWRQSARAWQQVALRQRRVPALTVVAPAYHAPRVELAGWAENR